MSAPIGEWGGRVNPPASLLDHFVCYGATGANDESVLNATRYYT